MKIRIVSLSFSLVLCSFLAPAQSLQDFEKRVTEFTLANGLHFIVIERHEAPVVSFHTYVNAGSVDDPGGETGIAHMFEHMAFKGTETIGTKNWPEEKKALDAVEHVYDRLDAERNKGAKADPKKVAELEQQLKAAMDKANSFVIPNAYPHCRGKRRRGLERKHGRGFDQVLLQLSVAIASSCGFCWNRSASMHPVFREFYKERDVVREERRMRVESSPQGQLVEALLATAFEAHPYHNMPGGWASDIENFRLPEADPVLQKILCAGEHHHRHRGRCGSQRMPASGGQVFLDPAVRSATKRAAHRGTCSEGRKARAGGVARPTFHGDRLQAAESKRQR